MRVWLSRLWRQPTARDGLRLGGKLLLLQVLIEIPFLILEATLLVDAATGRAQSLPLWQGALLVAAVYLLIEAGFLLVQRWHGNPGHRWFESERLLVGWIWGQVRRVVRRGKP